MKLTGWNRRDFLKAGVQVAGVAGVGSSVNLLAAAEPRGTVSTSTNPVSASPVSSTGGSTKFENEYLSRVAYPLGGIGAGMICLEGTGALSNVSIRNRPDLFNEPCVFAAVAIRGPKATARFGTVSLSDPDMPVTVELTGWSPFTPAMPTTPVFQNDQGWTPEAHEDR